MHISIIYEDDNMVAIDKPSGLMVHSDGKTTNPTLVDWIKKRYPQMEGVGEPIKLAGGGQIDRPGIVHRLDKETSGVLLIAKNQGAFLYLKKLFQEGKIRKTYRAIVHGALAEPVGVIDNPIGRSKKDFRLRSIDALARGVLREARTEYRVVTKSDSYSLLELYPKTGRTHQIRVHLKSIGHPIICDTLYAPGRLCTTELGRLGLHALSLQMVIPDGSTLKLEAPLPDDMARAIDFLLPKMR